MEAPTRPLALALDARSHHLFIARNDGKVAEYDSAGNPLGAPFAGGVSGADYQSLTVDPADHRVYVADYGTYIDEQQKITLSGAAAGTYKLSFGGQSTGATGTGDLHAFGPLRGTATSHDGSKTITDVTTTAGAFAVGQRIAGAGIAGAPDVDHRGRPRQRHHLQAGDPFHSSVNLRLTARTSSPTSAPRPAPSPSASGSPAPASRPARRSHR